MLQGSSPRPARRMESRLLCDPYAVGLRSRKIQISSASRVATPFLEFSFQDGASARVMPLGLPFRSSQGRPDQRT